MALVLLRWVPAQTIPFLGVAAQSDVGSAQAVGRLRRVLGAVKDGHGPLRGLGGEQVRILRHVSRSIHFAVVIDGLLDLDARSNIGMCSDLCSTSDLRALAQL